MDQPQNWKPELFGEWYARRIVLAEIPSLHSGKTHKVVISYLPQSWPLPKNHVNRFGFHHEPLNRIVGWGCVGPWCRVGSRVLGCCSHVATLAVYLGIYAYQPLLFKTTHAEINYFHVRNATSLNQKLVPQIQQQAPQQGPGGGDEDDPGDDLGDDQDQDRFDNMFD